MSIDIITALIIVSILLVITLAISIFGIPFIKRKTTKKLYVFICLFVYIPCRYFHLY